MILVAGGDDVQFVHAGDGCTGGVTGKVIAGHDGAVIPGGTCGNKFDLDGCSCRAQGKVNGIKIGGVSGIQVIHDVGDRISADHTGTGTSLGGGDGIGCGKCIGSDGNDHDCEDDEQKFEITGH